MKNLMLVSLGWRDSWRLVTLHNGEADSPILDSIRGVRVGREGSFAAVRRDAEATFSHPKFD